MLLSVDLHTGQMLLASQPDFLPAVSLLREEPKAAGAGAASSPQVHALQHDNGNEGVCQLHSPSRLECMTTKSAAQMLRCVCQPVLSKQGGSQ